MKNKNDHFFKAHFGLFDGRLFFQAICVAEVSSGGVAYGWKEMCCRGGNRYEFENSHKLHISLF